MKLVDRLKTWQVIVAAFLITITGVSAATGQLRWAYNAFHYDDITTLEEKFEAKLMVVSQMTSDELEKMRIRGEIRDINVRILSLKKQRAAVWKSSILTPKEQVELKEIAAELLELKDDKRNLKMREKELKK